MRNIIEEARVVLPGVQALFGFQTIAVFKDRFGELAYYAKASHAAALIMVIVFRRHGHDAGDLLPHLSGARHQGDGEAVVGDDSRCALPACDRPGPGHVHGHSYRHGGHVGTHDAQRCRGAGNALAVVGFVVLRPTPGARNDS